jgi:hypothetical protein
MGRLYHCDGTSDCRLCDLDVCRVETKTKEPKHNSLYDSLSIVLMEAFNQAAYGKGKERHASGDPYEQQPCCSIARKVGVGFPLGQAMKKIEESLRLEGERGINELLGAINYIAAAIIVLREEK